MRSKGYVAEQETVLAGSCAQNIVGKQRLWFSDGWIRFCARNRFACVFEDDRSVLPS